MMAQNVRNHARMCLFGVKIFNVVLATGRQTTIKIKQQFYCYLFVTMDNSRPKYKKNLIGFLGEYKIFFFGGGGIFPLWMPRINTGGRPPQNAQVPGKLTFDLLTLKVVSESRVTV